MNRSPYKDPVDEAQHAGAIAALARTLKLPVGEVTPVYEDELRQIKVDAVVTDYLKLFASRRARKRLAMQHRRKP